MVVEKEKEEEEAEEGRSRKINITMKLVFHDFFLPYSIATTSFWFSAL